MTDVKLCECGCGQPTPIATKNHTRSGAVKGQPLRFIRFHHAKGHGHAAGASPTYRSWQSMKQRCLNPTATGYENWGGRGITICDRWLESFENFLADMGERPIGTSIDRIDNDGNYEPSNCRWATPMEQHGNRRQVDQCHKGHPFDEANTRLTGEGRRCRTCDRERDRARTRPTKTGEPQNGTKTHCKHGHPFDKENTALRNGHRVCRECERASQRRYQERKKLGSDKDGWVR